MAATEIAWIPLKEDSKFEDPTNEAAITLIQCKETLLAQPGCHNMMYGRQHENANMLMFFVEWDSVQSHLDFRETEIYKPFLSKILAISFGEIKLQHILYASPLKPLADAPITEFIFAYFPPTYDTPEKFDAAFDKFTKEGVAGGAPHGFLGAIRGWVHEEVEHKAFAEQGGKGKCFVGTVGWTSLEAHMAVRETQAFKDGVGLIREGPVARELFHVVFHHGV
ncbi:hypothetical protein MMC25_002676 [Agyrium rufum]|nr:hypothetical protein [Agyrium rufum]